MEIAISSVFGALGGAAGGALSHDELAYLFGEMGVAQFDAVALDNVFQQGWDLFDSW